MAIELAPHGILVNAVGRGTIDTPLASAASLPERASASELDRTLLGRIGTFEDVAAAVRFLARDASWMTGQIIYVDGGFLATGLSVLLVDPPSAGDDPRMPLDPRLPAAQDAGPHRSDG